MFCSLSCSLECVCVSPHLLQRSLTIERICTMHHLAEHTVLTFCETILVAHEVDHKFMLCFEHTVLYLMMHVEAMVQVTTTQTQA